MSYRIKKTIFLFGIFALTGSNVFAQSGNEIDENSGFRDRIFTGGNFGLSFGNITYIEIAPLVGYRITNELSAGGGFSYRYRKDKRFTPDLTTSDYGINLFGRYNIFEPFYATLEYEFLSFEIPFAGGRDNFNSFLAGGGVSQPMGRNAALNFSVLYNLSYENPVPGDPPGPYDSPWIVRGGVSIGF